MVAAQPHYPEPLWGRRLLPSQETIDGIRVTRRAADGRARYQGARLRQELSFTAALAAAAPFLGGPLLPRPDLMLVGSPSFPALLPAIANSGPDGSRSSSGCTTSFLTAPPPPGSSRRTALPCEPRAGWSAPPTGQPIGSSSCPALRGQPAGQGRARREDRPDLLPRDDADPGGAARQGRGRSAPLISMGNIGLTQGLAELVRAFEASEEMERRGVRLAITGAGVAADAVRAEIRSERTQMPGLLDHEALAERAPALRSRARHPELRGNRVQPPVQAHELHGTGASRDRGSQSRQRGGQAGERGGRRLDRRQLPAGAASRNDSRGPRSSRGDERAGRRRPRLRRSSTSPGLRRLELRPGSQRGRRALGQGLLAGASASSLRGA